MTAPYDHCSQKRLDRPTYWFRTLVFEAIGAILVGPNLLLIKGM